MACSNQKKPPPLRPICRQTTVQKPLLPSSINSYLPELVDFIDVINLSTYLIAEGLLTYEERDIILSLKRKHLQVPELLQVLMTKGTNWYERFRAALIRSSSGNDVHLGHKELLEILPINFEASSVDEHYHQQLSPRISESVASPPYKNIQSSPRPIPRLNGMGTSYSNQWWYCRSCCLNGSPTTTVAAGDLRAQIAPSCNNSCAAECVAYSEKVSRAGCGASEFSPTCKSSNWSSAFSQQCSVLLTTVRDVESSLADMSIEKSNLQQENETLKEENKKLMQQVELLKRKPATDDTLVKQRKDKVKKTPDASTGLTTIKYFINQQSMDSAEAKDVEKTKILVRQSLNSFRFSYRREQHLKQFNLLVVADLNDNPEAKIFWCSSMTEAIVGHVLPSLQPSLKNVGMYEKIFDECNVKFSVSLVNLSDLSTLNMPFQPDLVVYCVNNVNSESYQEVILELSKKRLGPNMWRHSVVLVTVNGRDCYNHIKSSDLKLFNKVFAEEGLSDFDEARKNIPILVVPSESLSCIPHYVLNSFVAEFCLTSVQKTITPALCALLGLNLHRLQPASEVDYDTLPELLPHQPIPLTKLRGDVLSKCISSTSCVALSSLRHVSDDSTKNMQVMFLRKLCHE